MRQGPAQEGLGEQGRDSTPASVQSLPRRLLPDCPPRASPGPATGTLVQRFGADKSLAPSRAEKERKAGVCRQASPQRGTVRQASKRMKSREGRQK